MRAALIPLERSLKSRIFCGGVIAASCGGRLFSQSANGIRENASEGQRFRVQSTRGSAIEEEDDSDGSLH
jgi:hypothetical protein